MAEVPLIAKHEASPPVACTLDADALPERMVQWRELVALGERRSSKKGIAVLRFPADPDLAGRIATLAAAEQACCSFFTFTLRLDSDGAELTVEAPADAAELIEALLD